MNKYTAYLWSFASVALLVVLAPTATHAGTHSANTFTNFVDALIASNLVDADSAELARTIATHFDSISRVDVHIQVSQLIEHADRTYAAGDDVKGLVLIVRNEGETPVTLTGTRNCHVSYTIYQSNELLYDARQHGICSNRALSQYILAPGAYRMFEIAHPATAWPLDEGTYRFELNYPGYGSEGLVVTIE